MKIIQHVLFAGLLASLAGCATPVQSTDETGLSSSPLTVAECQAQKDRCVAGPFGWLFAGACQVTYDRCVADSDRPTPIRDAIAAAAACTQEAAACLDGASPSERIACGIDEAECLAEVLNVTVDIDGTAEAIVECSSDALGCIDSAEVASDLTACGGDLVECSVEVAEEVIEGVIPEEVVETIDTVLECTATLNACVAAATTPAKLALCGEQNVECVAGALNVTLPEIPASEAAQCATDAAECTVEAESISDVTGCAEDLLQCTESAIEPVLNPLCFLFPFLCQ